MRSNSQGCNCLFCKLFWSTFLIHKCKGIKGIKLSCDKVLRSQNIFCYTLSLNFSLHILFNDTNLNITYSCRTFAERFFVWSNSQGYNCLLFKLFWSTFLLHKCKVWLGTIQVLRHQRGGWVGLKKSKTWWRNTWMVPCPNE